MQANHYIIRINNTDALPQEQLINMCLIQNSCTIGQATIDFQFADGVEEIQMIGLADKYQTETGNKVNTQKSMLSSIHLRVKNKIVATGKFMAIVHV
jgi:hypothetical protein